VVGGYGSVASAVGSSLHGLSQISNAAGDRHAGDETTDSPTGARLMCDFTFAIALYLLDLARVQEQRTAPDAPRPAAPSYAPR
jgi:hypothetical protein